jgi:hypothetical protein
MKLETYQFELQAALLCLYDSFINEIFKSTGIHKTFWSVQLSRQIT